MKIIVTLISKNCFLLSYESKKITFLGNWWFGNEKYFCVFFISISALPQIQ